MIRYKMYKHINNTDVALVPMKIYYVPEKRIYKLTVRWINIVLKRNIDLGITQKIIIKADDMPNWRPYGEA